MMSMEAAEWGLDTAVMWFDSVADTCNLRWAVLALAWLCFLWLGLKNSPSVTEDFHLMSHQMSESSSSGLEVNHTNIARPVELLCR